MRTSRLPLKPRPARGGNGISLLAGLVILLASPTLAEDAPPLSADAFEALVEGLTFDTHDRTGSYGIETFLPGRRAIWRDALQCLEGTWRQAGDQICFDYIGEPLPYCWTYHDKGGWIAGYFEGDLATPIALYPVEELVTCEGFLGA